MKKVLILGVTGQDGSYLAELLLKKNYQLKKQALLVFWILLPLECCQ